MKKLMPLGVICIVYLITSGCAVITALQHPSKKDLRILSRGTGRESVIAYLGAPVMSEKENGKTIDIYEFVQGYSGGNKATRALTHGVLDVFTLFIWELVAWPAEAAVFDGDKMRVRVTYDENKKIEDFVFLERAG